jgi:hypothetical protein
VVFSVGAAQRMHIEDLCHAELEFRESPELAELLRRNGKKGISLCKEDFIVRCSYSETVIRCQDTTSED